MAKYVILVAGNICAGKSEFIKYVRKNAEGVIVPEFIDPEALVLFYRDRKAYSEIFEDSCVTGRIVRHMKLKHEPGIHWIDRGIVEGAETFCRNSFLEGYLSHEAYQRYIDKIKRSFDQLDRTQQQSWLDQLAVYLKVADPAILQERQRQRSTKGENIPLPYLRRINDLYEEFFGRIDELYAQYGVRPPKIVTIDASVDFNNDKEYHQRILTQMLPVMEGDLDVQRHE